MRSLSGDHYSGSLGPGVLTAGGGEAVGGSYLVSLLSRYGINTFGFLFFFASALITLPSASRDLLMFAPSFCCLLFCDTEARSEPDKMRED